MFAVAHLGGKGGLSRFIETGGAYNPGDDNGTRLSDYAARGHQGDIQQSPVIQSGVLRNQYGGPQAAQQGLSRPGVSPGLAPGDMRPAETAPQDRGIGALGTNFGQAWAARPDTTLSPQARMALLEDVQLEVDSDPAFKNMPADVKVQEVNKRIAAYLATASGKATPTSTPESRMNTFRSILGLPQPKT
jgi:hypothetical protein